ncbi:MAG: FAD:protein FMN transferase [Chitinophagaceae bacterium]
MKKSTQLTHLALCLLFSLTALFGLIRWQAHPPLKSYHIRGYGQGTTYSITYFAEDSIVSQNNIDSIITSIDSSLSLYKSYSLINRFNGASRGLQPDLHLRHVVKEALRIFKTSGGIFDITVQPLVSLWGFGKVKPDSLPGSKQIAHALKSVGSGKLRLTSDSLVKMVPSVTIDLNGIAQGYTVDVICRFLDNRKISNYLVELGGEVRVRGAKAGGEAFTIGIESPAENAYAESIVRQTISLNRGAITTSGNYRNFYTSGGKIISHLIDPRTGYSINNEMISASVWAPEAMTADGYDNVLMGMGIKKALLFMKRQRNMEAYFIYRKPNGTIADTATAGFQKMFKNQHSAPASH